MPLSMYIREKDWEFTAVLTLSVEILGLSWSSREGSGNTQGLAHLTVKCAVLFFKRGLRVAVSVGNWKWEMTKSKSFVFRHLCYYYTATGRFLLNFFCM